VKNKTPSRLHLDKRVETILANPGEGSNDDDLLTSIQVANWLGVSPQWVELGRHKNYGPPFVRIAPNVVRYKRNVVIAWLKDREFRRTSDYVTDCRRKAARPSKNVVGSER
jgi:hypothetical protein